MQEGMSRRSNAERREKTVGKLLAAGRSLFLEKGYAETGTPEIVKRAGVTRGALYHHFADKLDLFRAVVRQEAAAVAAEIGAKTATAMDPSVSLMTGADAYFDAMAAPGRAFLLLVEGPAVLGRAEMHTIDMQTGGEELLQGLRYLAEHSRRDIPAEATATLLSAMFDRAALAISDGQDPGSYRRAIHGVIKGLL